MNMNVLYLLETFIINKETIALRSDVRVKKTILSSVPFNSPSWKDVTHGLRATRWGVDVLWSLRDGRLRGLLISLNQLQSNFML